MQFQLLFNKFWNESWKATVGGRKASTSHLIFPNAQVEGAHFSSFSKLVAWNEFGLHDIYAKWIGVDGIWELWFRRPTQFSQNLRADEKSRGKTTSPCVGEKIPQKITENTLARRFEAEFLWKLQKIRSGFEFRMTACLNFSHCVRKSFVELKKKCRVWKMLWKRSWSTLSLRKGISVASVSTRPRSAFPSTTGQLFRRTRKTVRRNVLKLAVVELFLAIGTTRSPHFAILHTRLDCRSHFAVSLVPLFARSTFKSRKNCLALVLLISISKSVPSGSNFSYLPKK